MNPTDSTDARRAPAPANRRCLSRSRAVVLATLLGGLLVPSLASAQQLEVDLDCPTAVGAQVFGRDRCTIEYSNSNDFALSNVVFTVTWDNVIQTDYATALPDGVPTLTDPTRQLWRPVYLILAVAGSPSPSNGFDSNDPPRRTTSFTVSNIPAGNTSVIEFDWLFPVAFPESSFGLSLATTIGGVPDATDAMTATWDSYDLFIEARVPRTVERGRRYHGNAAVDRLGNNLNAHTNARLEVYLPYYDETGALVADGNYLAGQDTPFIDDSDLWVEMILPHRAAGRASAPVRGHLRLVELGGPGRRDLRMARLRRQPGPADHLGPGHQPPDRERRRGLRRRDLHGLDELGVAPPLGRSHPRRRGRRRHRAHPDVSRERPGQQRPRVPTRQRQPARLLRQR